jgi:RNA polymerase sigma factor (sigma-70 family)
MKISLNPDLIQNATEGDADAIEELLRQCQPSVARFARRYCAADDIEDAVQETLWTLYQKIGTLRMTQAFMSWMFQVVRHHCYRLLSSHKHEDSQPVIDMLSEIEDESDPLYQDLKQDVITALTRLPTAYRHILILRDLEGYSAPEVAAQLDITIDTVKSRLQRGRHLMRQMLEHWVV